MTNPSWNPKRCGEDPKDLHKQGQNLPDISLHSCWQQNTLKYKVHLFTFLTTSGSAVTLPPCPTSTSSHECPRLYIACLPAGKFFVTGLMVTSAGTFSKSQPCTVAIRADVCGSQIPLKTATSPKSSTSTQGCARTSSLVHGCFHIFFLSVRNIEACIPDSGIARKSVHVQPLQVFIERSIIARVVNAAIFSDRI